MKRLLILLPFFFLFILACDSTTGGDSCTVDTDCGDGVCFYNGCYDKDDKILGVKTIHLVGDPNIALVSGETITLKAQVILAPTKEMTDKFKGKEDELRKILGPIASQDVNFSITVVGETLSTVVPTGITDEFGMVDSIFTAQNNNTEQTLNVVVSSEGCQSKTFKVSVSPRKKVLTLITDENLPMYISSKRMLIAQVTTNGGVPYENQEVTFKIEGNTSGSDASIEPITVSTNFTGLAKVELNAGDKATSYSVVVSSTATASKTISVSVIERDGGCMGNDDCTYLGEAYQCEDGVCVYVPIPCTEDADCPDNYECNDDGKCIEKPFICEESELDTCRCIRDTNCPNNLSCIRNRCVEDNTPCQTHLDCPNGLICRDNVCTPRGRECKIDENCHSLHADKCPEEDSCLCQDGFCVNPCPDTNYIELSGGSGDICSNDSQCADNEVCFTAHDVNRCIVKWDANYDFHLIEALPPTLGSILSGIGRLLGPVSDIITGDDIDWGLPGWLSWAEEYLADMVRPLLDQYVPAWLQDLIVGLDNSIDILQEMRVKAIMSFVHSEEFHADVKGFEFWDKFYVQWHNEWTEVTPNSEEDGDDFQVNSAPFTGNVACQMDENGNPKYILYIDRHPAEFYFGRFVKAFIDNLLIPATTNDRAHSIDEVLDLYIDCVSISDSILEAARNYLGEFASYLPPQIIVSACEMGKDAISRKIYQKIAELKFGGEGSDSFTFEGSATIKTRNVEGIKLKDGTYTGVLDVGGARNFTADWEAQKDR